MYRNPKINKKFYYYYYYYFVYLPRSEVGLLVVYGNGGKFTLFIIRHPMPEH